MYSGSIDEFGHPHGKGAFYIEFDEWEDYWDDWFWLFLDEDDLDEGMSQYSYSGTWVKGEMYGEFEMSYSYDDEPNASYDFEGWLACGKPVGECRKFYGDGSSYEGRVADDFTLDGAGIFTDPDGNIMIAEWRDGNMSPGNVKLEYTNGNWFQGVLDDNGNLLSGEMLIHYDNGTVYEGQVADNVPEGEGKLQYADGSSYCGQFKNGQICGKGRLTFENGDFMEGTFSDMGLFESGSVKISMAGGFVYEGEWSGGTRNGRGRITSSEGYYYDGIFKDGDLVEGTCRTGDGDGLIYEGGVKDGLYHGHGKLYDPSGASMEGNFKNGDFHGEFIVTDIDGNVRKESFGTAEKLTVNDQTSLEMSVSQYPQTLSFDVDTDWGSFSVSNVLSWVEVCAQTRESFDLKLSRNNEPTPRSGVIYVRAGGKSVRLHIRQEGDAYAVNGNIERVWVTYGATRGWGMYMTQGIEVHLDFNVKNLKGTGCNAVAYFEFSNGQRLFDGNGQYRATDGQVSAYQNFTPAYANTRYEDLTIYIPYDELHLGAGQHQLRCRVFIFDMSTGDSVCSSDYCYFGLQRYL